MEPAFISCISVRRISACRRRAWLVPDSIEGSKVRKDTDSLNATSRFRVLGNIIKQIRLFLSEARAWCAQGQQVDGFGHDQLQTSQLGCDVVNSDCDPGIRTASCRRTRHAGVFPEPGCWIPRQPDSERHGVGTRFVCERAGEPHFSKVQDKAAPISRYPISSKGGLTDAFVTRRAVTSHIDQRSATCPRRNRFRLCRVVGRNSLFESRSRDSQRTFSAARRLNELRATQTYPAVFLSAVVIR